MIAYSHETPIGFELCGATPASCRYAEAKLEGSRVVLPLPVGFAATRVRYCWADSPVCTLFDRSGLPAGPFELNVLPPPVHLTSEQDHQRMMGLLHINALRRGPDGDPTSPQCGQLRRVQSQPGLAAAGPAAAQEWPARHDERVVVDKRRPEIVEAFDSEIYGRVPRNVPKVSWHVTRTAQGTIGNQPAVTKEIVGHVDNSAYPLINVDIQLSLTTPAARSRTGAGHDGSSDWGREQLAALRKRLSDTQWASFVGPVPAGRARSWRRVGATRF